MSDDAQPFKLPEDHPLRHSMHSLYQAANAYLKTLAQSAADLPNKKQALEAKRTLTRALEEVAIVADERLAAYQAGGRTTCERCSDALICPYAFDSHNIDGDCIADK